MAAHLMARFCGKYVPHPQQQPCKRVCKVDAKISKLSIGEKIREQKIYFPGTIERCELAIAPRNKKGKTIVFLEISPEGD